jgi:hypothetical protein
MARIYEKDGKYLVKCGSHRGRDKVYSLLGYRPQEYVSLRRDTSRGILEVSVEELRKVKASKIKGIVQTYWSECLMYAWG